MLALTNGRILTMAGKDFDGGTVLISEGRIKEVGDKVIVPLEAKRIDLQGQTVMPGLIDAHCHVGIAEEIYRIEGDDTNEYTEPVTPHLRALDGVNPFDEAFQDAWRSGVTTICTGPGSANIIAGESLVMKTYGKIADKMVLRQPAGLKIAFGENPKRVYGEQKKMPATRMAVAALLRENLVKAQKYRDKLQQGLEDPGKRPDRDLKLEPLVRVLEGQIPLRAHVHRADDIMTAIRISEEFQVPLVLDHCTEGHLIVQEIAARNLPVVVGPTFTSRAKVELKNRTFQTPGILSRAGVKVALMSDHPVIPIEHLIICAALAVKEGMEEGEALKAITINAAEILGVSSRVGSIEVGKDADLLVLDGSPLAISSPITKVFIEGKIVLGEI